MFEKINKNITQIKTKIKTEKYKTEYISYKQNLINNVQNQKSSSELLENIENTQESLKLVFYETTVFSKEYTQTILISKKLRKENDEKLKIILMKYLTKLTREFEIIEKEIKFILEIKNKYHLKSDSHDLDAVFQTQYKNHKTRVIDLIKEFDLYKLNK